MLLYSQLPLLYKLHHFSDGFNAFLIFINYDGSLPYYYSLSCFVWQAATWTFVETYFPKSQTIFLGYISANPVIRAQL